MRSLLVLVSIAFVGSASAVDITTCGQSVPDFDTGVLQADLNCPTEGGLCVPSMSTTRKSPAAATVTAPSR